MGSDKKIMDDIARVAGGAVNILSGLQQQVREEMRSRVDDIANRMDLVPRGDLETIHGVLDRLAKQLDSLEARLDVLEKGGSVPKAKKAAAVKQKPKKKKS